MPISKKARNAEQRRKDEARKRRKKMDRLGVTSLPPKKSHRARTKRKGRKS